MIAMFNQRVIMEVRQRVYRHCIRSSFSITNLLFIDYQTRIIFKEKNGTRHAKFL